MKKNQLKISLAIVFQLWFCLAFAVQNDKGQTNNSMVPAAVPKFAIDRKAAPGLVLLQRSGKGESPELVIGVTAMLIAIFGGLGILTFVLIRVSLKRQASRAAQFRQLAFQFGFIYTEKPVVPDFLRNTRFALSSPIMMGGGMNNLLQGVYNGVPILIFDFGLAEATGTNININTRQTVICVPGNLTNPFFFYQENKTVESQNIPDFLNQALNALYQNR